jgi:hypothetical protein
MLNNFLCENCIVCYEFVEKYGGDWGATKDVTIWRMGVACWIGKGTCSYVHADAHALGYPHAHTHAHACAHRLINNTYWFSKATIIRERTSVLLSTYIALLVRNKFTESSVVYLYIQVATQGRVSTLFSKYALKCALLPCLVLCNWLLLINAGYRIPASKVARLW